MCIAYKMFPVKMCNSFHALKSDAAKWQRGGSKLMPLLRDIGSLSELLDDDAICKRTRKSRTGNRVSYDEDVFPDFPPLRSTTEDTGGASTDTTVMDESKMKLWWQGNGGLTIEGYTPESLAVDLSLRLALAKRVNDAFLENLKMDLVNIPDELLRTFVDGHYLVELKKTLGQEQQ
jgi:hypothetical protein